MINVNVIMHKLRCTGAKEKYFIKYVNLFDFLKKKNKMR